MLNLFVCVCGRDWDTVAPPGIKTNVCFGIFCLVLILLQWVCVCVCVGHVARANGRIGRGARRGIAPRGHVCVVAVGGAKQRKGAWLRFGCRQMQY